MPPTSENGPALMAAVPMGDPAPSLKGPRVALRPHHFPTQARPFGAPCYPEAETHPHARGPHSHYASMLLLNVGACPHSIPTSGHFTLNMSNTQLRIPHASNCPFQSLSISDWTSRNRPDFHAFLFFRPQIQNPATNCVGSAVEVHPESNHVGQPDPLPEPSPWPLSSSLRL